ncbi:MAG: FxsA family protein [Pirellulales bacterium]|nr:FxsA family protein [Pirellulales bacterium]
MLPRLLLLFTVVPIAELILLIYLAQQTSLLTAIGLVIVTGVVGAILVKFQGLLVWRRMGDQLRSGQAPTDAILDGLMILSAGCLLITPGIITDVLGFLLLMPPTRAMIRGRVRNRVTTSFRQQMAGGSWTMSGSFSSESPSATQQETNDKIVEARVVEQDDPRLEKPDTTE